MFIKMMKFIRRIGFTIIFLLQLIQSSSIGIALASWSTIWSDNRSQILALTAINTSITVINESLARNVSSHWIEQSSRNAFLVKENSTYHINRQSLINIWATLLTSLFGGVVFFMQKKSHRFIYFCIFGLGVSLVSQCCSHLMCDGILYVSQRRLVFDLTYLCSIKYIIFESGRGKILSSAGRPGRLGGIRLSQDFVTTQLRVIALNLIGLKG